MDTDSRSDFRFGESVRGVICRVSGSGGVSTARLLPLLSLVFEYCPTFKMN